MNRLKPACALIALVLAVAHAHSAATRPATPRDPRLPRDPRPQTSAPADIERAYRANNIGVAQLEQFDYDAAARSFREALGINPSLAIARLNLAIALFYGGKPAEAATEVRAAVASLPASPYAHYVAGLIAKAEDRVDDALAAFAQVAAIDPRDAGAKVNLGQIHLQRRNYQEALSLFQAALAAEPFNVTAAYNVALALIRSGEAEQGRQAMQRFEALRDSAYGVTYSQLYLSQGRYGEAIASTGAEVGLVNAAPPDVTFSEAFKLPGSPGSGGVQGRGGVTLLDVDGDADLDLLETGAGARFYRNDHGKFSDLTDKTGLSTLRGSVLLGAAAGDYDNDGKQDLLLLATIGVRLLHQLGTGAFEDVSVKAGVPSSPSAAATAAFSDVDHDGDLDIAVAGSGMQLLRNNGNGTFLEITKDAGLSAALPRAVAIAATDYDNRRDIDLLVLSHDRVPTLYRNMRDGTFRDASADVGMPAAGSYTALAVGDVNKDGYTDFFFARAQGAASLASSDGQGAFRNSEMPEAAAGAIASQFADYDNDGLLDLLTLSAKHVQILRNVGANKWVDVTERAAVRRAAPTAAFQAMAVGDLDADGAVDVVLRTVTGELHGWRNQGGNKNASLPVRLTARVSNRSSIGAKVEVRAGSLRQLRETSSSTPAVAPADLVFGLGSRPSADVVRILWPAGILQAETIASAASTRAQLNVTELDRKPSSCPYLFTWNGSRFEFVSDFMGGAEMGAWLGPRTWNQPDPDEYVRIRETQLRPRGGRYELRVTNELEEGLFVDRLQLVAVDHPAGVDVFPNEGLKSPPRPPFDLTVTKDARPPAVVLDHHGHDVRPQIVAIDRRYADDFDVLPIRGYAAAHTLTLDPGTDRDDIVLLMTGWTDYAFSNDNVAASQRGAIMQPPAVQVKDAAGRWRTVIDDMGFPVGRPQTVPVRLKGKFLSASRQVRIITSMRIYWDQILVDTSGGGFPTRVTRIDPVSAELRDRGFSAETTPDGREPFGYDYDRVSSISPWQVMVGQYTRLGDVRPLLVESDDMFVVSRPGDEIAVSFDVAAFPPLPPHWTRTFLLYSDGFSKEMNPRSASPDALGPLPFHAMSGYPYGPREHYPRSPAHRQYLEQYNTRVVTRPIPSIDATLLMTASQRP